jgi:26S proteasome regulatory subunit N5
MVDYMVEVFDQMPTREEKYNHLNAQIDAADGKMYLECQYARSIKTYCAMLQEDGKLKEAAAKIQDLQVETYGSMEKKEKTQFILSQLHYVLQIKDFVRTQIISRKISKKHIQDKGFEYLKVQYYQFMV